MRARRRRHFTEVLTAADVLRRENLLLRSRKPKPRMGDRVQSFMRSAPGYVDKIGKGVEDFGGLMDQVGRDGEELMGSMSFDLDGGSGKRRKR